MSFQPSDLREILSVLVIETFNQTNVGQQGQGVAFGSDCLSDDGDFDGDGVSNINDAFPGIATESKDADGDFLGDNEDLDDDNDGTADASDAFPNDPNYQSDDDGDGLPDSWETSVGLDPTDPTDAAADPDQDGALNSDEFLAGTDPFVSQGVAQIIYTDGPVYMIPGVERSIAVHYDVSDENDALTGIGLRVHFNSQQIDSIEIADVFATNLLSVDNTPQDDVDDSDGDPSTDKFLLVAWVDFSGGGWPLSLPTTLFNLKVTASEGALQSDSLPIRFSATDLASGYRLVARDLANPVLGASMDIDGDGTVGALTDGLMIIRYLFKFSGDLLVATQLAPMRW